jgi:hypothetical protein
LKQEVLMLKLLDKAEYGVLASLMCEKYTIYLDERTFHIEAKDDGAGVRVKTVLNNKDDSYYYPVEARMMHVKENLEPRKAVLFLINYIDGYFEDYLTEMESTYLLIDWSDVEYEGVDFQIKGQVANRKIDLMADDLIKVGEVYTGPNKII